MGDRFQYLAEKLGPLNLTYLHIADMGTMDLYLNPL